MSERTMELWWTGRPRSRPRTLFPYDGAGLAEVTGQPNVGEHAAARVRGRASVIDVPVVLRIAVPGAVIVAVMVISTGLASSRRIGARAKTRALGICASRLSAR
jgi:hypothetical protein